MEQINVFDFCDFIYIYVYIKFKIVCSARSIDEIFVSKQLLETVHPRYHNGLPAHTNIAHFGNTNLKSIGGKLSFVNVVLSLQCT